MLTPNPMADGVSLGLALALTISFGIFFAVTLASYACFCAKSGAVASTAPVSDTDTDDDSTIIGGVSRYWAVSDSSGEAGLDRPTIDSFPTHLLGQSLRLPGPNSGPCSICLAEYETKEAVRSVPECGHCFHADCIDGWLRMRATCPICRKSPAPSTKPTACPVVSDVAVGPLDGLLYS